MAIQAQLCSDNFGVRLGCSQDLVMDNVFNETFFNLQHKQHFQQQMNQNQFQHQLNQNMCYGNTCVVPSTINNNIGNPVGTSFACQMESQRRELDQYVRLQNEKLIRLLHGYKNQQLGMMLKKIESKASNLLRQKDAEISKAAKTTMELEQFVRKLEMEKLQWQRVAQENEVMAVSLNNTLDELRENNYINSNNDVEDAESCCGDVNMEDDEKATEEGTSKRGDQSNRNMMMACKGCNSWSSCMLFLPCRHLCSCKKCEAVLDRCPVCGVVKKNSMEALIF